MTISNYTVLDDPPLYPPTVAPAQRTLSLPEFLYKLVRNPLRVTPDLAYQQPITVLGGKGGGRQYVWLAEPELIKTVLLDERAKFPKSSDIDERIFGPILGDGILTAKGADWRWQRQIVAPLFRSSELADYVPKMTTAAEDLLEDWRNRGSRMVQPIDRDMTKVTFAVIASTIMTADESFDTAPMEKAIDDYLAKISWEIAYGMLNVPNWLWHPAKRRMRVAQDTLRAAVTELVRAHRKDEAERDDLLARLMKARHPETDEPMPDALIIDNVLTFLAAGHETTAKALTWTIYLLARAPHWQERIAQEVKDVTRGAPIDGTHIDRLVQTQQVLKESMRLYPPVPLISRQSAGATELGGEKIKERAFVTVPIFSLHRHRKLWHDPDRFDPTRFAPEREKSINRYQYMPFGAGPRICIGASFAMMEATAILATLLRRARFEWVRGHAPEPISRVTLRPKGGMPLRVWVS